MYINLEPSLWIDRWVLCKKGEISPPDSRLYVISSLSQELPVTGLFSDVKGRKNDVYTRTLTKNGVFTLLYIVKTRPL